MAEAIIRLAEPADLPAMTELIERQLRKHVLRDCTREGANALVASVEPAALQRNMDAGYTYHVAAAADMIYGVVGMKPPCHLHHLFVADVMQRQGLGRKLWQVARDSVCLQQSLPPVFTANSSLAAVPFYRHLGFDASGEPQEQNGVRFQPMRYVMLGARLK
jgi:GNAT superfamily N-acetyltransferase